MNKEDCCDYCLEEGWMIPRSQEGGECVYCGQEFEPRVFTILLKDSGAHPQDY